MWYPQLKLWLFQARNAMLPAWIRKNVDIPASVVKEYNCRVVQTDEVVCNCKPRYYVALPTYEQDGQTRTVEILSLDRNRGIVDVFIGVSRLERAVTRSELRQLVDIGGEEIFYPVSDRIYLFGGNYPPSIRVHLALIITSAEAFDLSDQFPAPGELLLPIMEEAEKIGLRQIGKPQDITNDGQAAPASL